MTFAEIRHVQWLRDQDAADAQAAVDTAYARGRRHGAVRAYVAAAAMAAARARRDLDVARRNRALLAAAEA